MTSEPSSRAFPMGNASPNGVLAGRPTPPSKDGLAAYIFIGSARHEFGRLCAPARREHEQAFKRVSGAIGDDPTLGDLIATRIVELAKGGVYDVEELSRRTLTSLRSVGYSQEC